MLGIVSVPGSFNVSAGHRMQLLVKLPTVCALLSLPTKVCRPLATCATTNAFHQLRTHSNFVLVQLCHSISPPSWFFDFFLFFVQVWIQIRNTSWGFWKRKASNCCSTGATFLTMEEKLVIFSCSVLLCWVFELSYSHFKLQHSKPAGPQPAAWLNQVYSTIGDTAVITGIGNHDSGEHLPGYNIDQVRQTDFVQVWILSYQLFIYQSYEAIWTLATKMGTCKGESGP